MSAAPARAAPPPPPPADDQTGASANERLLAAAKSDNEGMLEDALSDLDDINYTDGMGNTALHHAIIHASTSILETILSHETCDVDPRNRMGGETPLHIAVRNKWEEAPGLRLFLVEQLLEAGADTSIRNRHNQKPIDLLPPSPDSDSDEAKIRAMIRHVEAENAVAARGDVVDEDNDVFDPNDVASDSD
ncbi:ankyrin repeat-containing domain protein [Dioszegia hungarica]|uniref:Ankyrin repeat-containing domain protein n=1 Tax=Dioszegia hungarica TaxID=4972 RepID=A0AA38LT74_9TREE|nr:ankyrin repeat-containing domain protein [Dioszegia hungarica]KAI9632221.1 ankyrin repeat-containing domain protein [Dioszegia hungarica]